MPEHRDPFVAILHDCHVLYEGRARAEQEGGTVVIVVKANGAIAAHDLESGTQPQFYNPKGRTEVQVHDDTVRVQGVSNEEETLKIEGEPELIHEVPEYGSRHRPDREQVRGLERDLVRWIKKNPEEIGLEGEPMEEVRRVRGRFGLLFGSTVVEVKRRASVKHFDQILRYLRDPDVEQAILVCLQASENLESLCGDEPGVRLVLLDKDGFMDGDVQAD